MQSDKGIGVLLYVQDKINQDGFPDAVDDLSKAADVLSKVVGAPVLCVAHVIGAADQTRAHTRFRHAYILVRDAEVDAFYTPSFAPAIRFVRARRSSTHGSAES
jgi:hypothetical protein